MKSESSGGEEDGKGGEKRVTVSQTSTLSIRGFFISEVFLFIKFL